jgi:Rubisco Assembly chaperone C-terminal domain/Rubisco accumulation factor 1 alpha helical domain/Rubisco accumulation factor 1 helix turn helix domain
MSPSPEDQAQIQEIVQSLRRKEGNWLAWGKACQTLQKAGYSQQKIFEETGFEPIQQNQITVAAQVYSSLESGDAPPEVLARFERTGSDSLYELRVLTQAERVAAAALVVERGLDSEGAGEVTKALKDFGRFKAPPEFSDYPSDAIAHYYWKLARQQADLQARSRLIAQGLRFAKSESARLQIEKLLTDFTITRTKAAPKLPFYRLESASDQPRILPVVGKLPLTTADLQAVPMVEEDGAFRLVKFSGVGAWVSLPSWQVVLGAEDPVMLLADSTELPSSPDTLPEEVLVLVDRAQRQWDEDNHFVVDQAGQLQVAWFEVAPTVSILGKVVLVLRPNKVLDEDYNKELWQIDE